MNNEREYCQTIKNQFLINHIKNPEQSWPNDVQRALNCINENLFDYEFNIETMRKMCKIPQKNFSGRFKYFVNQTPVSYLKLKRVECAIEILKNAENMISINSIAIEVGYSYVSTFSSAFRNITGKSPTSFLRTEIDN